MVFINAVNIFFQFIYFMVFIRVILSWFPTIDLNIVQFIYQVTDPILEPARRLCSNFKVSGAGFYIDFSPVITLLGLDILRRVIVRILVHIIIL